MRQRYRDAGFAVWSILVGLAGLWLTRTYGAQARHFPQALSGIILFAGLAILVMALRPDTEKEGDSASPLAPEPESLPKRPEPRHAGAGPDTPPPPEADRAAERAGLLQGALPFAAVLIAWALAVSYGAGYLLPGFVAGLALMAIAGARGPAAIAAGAAGTILFCFTMFYIVFKTRIPETEYVRSLVAPLRDLF